MSCLATLLNGCENIQDELTAYFPTCSAQFFKEPMPFAEWMMSPVNRGSLETVIAPGQGKYRNLNVRYRKRLLESDVKVNQSTTCSSSSQIGDCLASYTIDTTQNVQEDKYIPEGFLNASCRSNPKFFMETLMMMIDVVERKVATNWATEAGAAFGTWANDVSVTSSELVVKTLVDSTTTGQPFPTTMQKIATSLVKTGYCAPYAIFAGDLLYQYYLTLATGCCASTGVGLDKQFAQFNQAIMYDRRIMNSIGTFASQDKALVVMQGALQVIEWNLNDWKKDLDPIFKGGQNYFSTILISPRLGLSLDFRMADNCGNVSLILTATNKVVGMPADMFPVGDVYQGVNFVNKIKVTNV